MIDSVAIDADEEDGATTMRALRPFLMARGAFGATAAALAIVTWLLDLRYLPWPFAAFALIALVSASRAMRRVYLGIAVPVGSVATSRRTLLVLGVVVAVVLCALPDRPGGWIGGPTAASMPNACDVLTPQLLAPFGVRAPEPETSGSRYVETSECTWNRPDGDLVLLTYQLFDRHGLHSGQDEARHASDAGLRTADLYLQFTRVPDATTNAHGIASPLFTAHGEATDAVAYVTVAVVGNVIVSVGVLGPFSIDQFSTFVHTATAAVRIPA